MPIPQRWSSLADLARHLARRQEWLPLREAAELYRVTPETMLAWVRQNRFRSCEHGATVWVLRAQLEEALRRRPGAVTEEIV
jgi:hypothetical protein